MVRLYCAYDIKAAETSECIAAHRNGSMVFRNKKEAAPVVLNGTIAHARVNKMQALVLHAPHSCY